MKFKKVFLFLSIILFTIINANNARATEQYPDSLVYNGESYNLYVSWGFPSPLQTYFLQTEKASPFRMWGTANYRGYVATWKVENGELRLCQVDTRQRYSRTGTSFPGKDRSDTVAPPAYFDIHPVGVDATQVGGSIVADWFSGVITAYPIVKGKVGKKDRYTLYFYVRHGKVLDVQTIRDKDMKKINKFTVKDTANHELLGKYRMLYLNQNYISFYFRLGLCHDSIYHNGRYGRLKSQGDWHSFLLEHYSNDPMQWPYNWENFQQNGAPVCLWELSHDSILLTTVNLMYGLGFEKYDVTSVNLADFLSMDEHHPGKVFANWMNGEYTIQYGTMDTTGFSPEFKVLSTSHLLVKDGIVKKTSSFLGEPNDNPLRNEPALCNAKNIYKVAAYKVPFNTKAFAEPATAPEYVGGLDSLQAYFDTHPLTDPRIQGETFSVSLSFIVTCKGEMSGFSIFSPGESIVFELASQVMDVARRMPSRWAPATDNSGQAVDCYQVITFTVIDGKLKVSYAK